MGLREQIKIATSDAEIAVLLNAGNKYEWASEQTQRRWKSTARFRLAKLSSNDSDQSSEKSVVTKKPPINPKRINK